MAISILHQASTIFKKNMVIYYRSKGFIIDLIFPLTGVAFALLSTLEKCILNYFSRVERRAKATPVKGKTRSIMKPLER